MNEHDSLLAAVRREPDVDLHRLAYADWIQEHGQESRAVFIREQIAKSATLRIVNSLSHDFTAPIDPGYEATNEFPGVFTYRRGFAEVVRCDAGIWMRNHETILSLPYVCLREVRLTTVPEGHWEDDDAGEVVLRFVGGPTVREIEVFEYRCDIGRKGVAVPGHPNFVSHTMADVLETAWRAHKLKFVVLPSVDWNNPPGDVAEDVQEMAEEIMRRAGASGLPAD